MHRKTTHRKRMAVYVGAIALMSFVGQGRAQVTERVEEASVAPLRVHRHYINLARTFTFGSSAKYESVSNPFGQWVKAQRFMIRAESSKFECWEVATSAVSGNADTRFFTSSQSLNGNNGSSPTSFVRLMVNGYGNSTTGSTAEFYIGGSTLSENNINFDVHSRLIFQSATLNHNSCWISGKTYLDYTTTPASFYNTN